MLLAKKKDIEESLPAFWYTHILYKQNHLKLSERLYKQVEKLFRHVFPKQIIPDKGTLKLLEQIYPSLNLSKVHFFDGLPWFIGDAYVSGIAMPGTYNTDKVHIYLKKYNPRTQGGLAIIVHELFHALQYQDLYKAKGIGLMRLFIVHYLSNYIRLYFKYLRQYGHHNANRLAYEFHPMEIPAFQQEHAFLYLLKTAKGVQPEDIKWGNCVCDTSGYKNPAGKGWLLLGWIIASLMMLAKPFVEIFFLFLAGILSVFSFIFRVIGL